MTDRSRRCAVRVLVFAIAGVAFGVGAQESSTGTLMRAKRDHAHRLLDAVVQQEFEVARDRAFRLKALAATADWNVVDTREYARRSDGFVHAAERLRLAAVEENGEELLTAFLDLTGSCAGCHRYVRTLDR